MHRFAEAQESFKIIAKLNRKTFTWEENEIEKYREGTTLSVFKSTHISTQIEAQSPLISEDGEPQERKDSVDRSTSGFVKADDKSIR